MAFSGGAETDERTRHLCFILQGNIIHAPRYGEVELLEDVLVGVDCTGHIAFVSAEENYSSVTNEPLPIKSLPKNSFLVPGFVDCHVHAPQYTYAGTATDLPLLGWLEQHAYPSEERFSNTLVAHDVYSTVVANLLGHGTTCALYFASIHLESCKILADVAVAKGQRAFIGKVCMDQYSPTTYCESTEAAIAATEEFIGYVANKQTKLVSAAITPRFIPSCSMKLLEGLGELGSKYNVVIQSHIAESRDEVALVEQIHATADEVTIFDRAGLLKENSLFAHGTQLFLADVKRMSKKGASIVHCPLSNWFFGNGALPVAFLKKNINNFKCALGTDVAGGYSPSMLSSIRNAVITSKAIQNGFPTIVETTQPPGQKEVPTDFSFKHAFWLATVGGAQCLGLEHTIGTLVPGKSFDALLVCPSTTGFHVSAADNLMDIFEKWINLGDDRNIRRVWVAGRLVVDKMNCNKC